MKKTDDLNGENQMQPQNSSGDDLAGITDGILLDTRARIGGQAGHQYADCGAGDLGGGRCLASACVPNGDTDDHRPRGWALPAGKRWCRGRTEGRQKRNFWGAFKTAQGTSKFAQLQAAGFSSSELHDNHAHRSSHRYDCGRSCFHRAKGWAA